MSNPRIPIKFDIYRGEQYLRSETFAEPIVKIGKVASSHLRLEDDLASRMHAMIEVTGPDEIYIIDLGSAAGTFVNGQRSNKARLQNGDEIVVGETRLIVEIGAGDEDSTMAVDRSRVGVDFAAMAAEHADPSASAPVSIPAPAARPAAPRPAPAKPGTLIGMQAPAVGSVPPPAAGLGSFPPPARGSVPPPGGGAFAPPPAAARPGAPNPFGNPFAAPAAPAAPPPRSVVVPPRSRLLPMARLPMALLLWCASARGS